MRPFVLACLLLGATLQARVPQAPALVADIDTDINAVTADFVKTAIEEAGRTGAPFVVLRIDTPGGRLDSTRDITQTILSSRVPVVGFVTPPGARAASAGFMILMACDVAAMAPGTNAGAASPVDGEGKDLSETMDKKVKEDASALMRSVVGPRERPIDAAVKTITDAVAYSETEACEKKLVEIVAHDLPDLLKQLDGRTIKRIGKPDAVLQTAGVGTTIKRMTSLQRALGVIANPALAGILFLLGLAGLYAEMQHPGASFPGVLGGICLVLALFAMSVLPTSYAGVGLILLGLLFFFLEVKLMGHGLFAVGGAVALVLGSALLFHQNDLSPSGEIWWVVAGAGSIAAVLTALSFKAISVQSLPDRTGSGALIGQVAVARTDVHGSGQVFLDGALWEARSTVPVAPGEEVEVVSLDGLLVTVRPRRAPQVPTAPAVAR